MSLLPQQILPETVPFGRADQNGTVTIDHNWWLLFYNVCLQVLGNSSNGLPSSAVLDIQSVTGVSLNADAIVLRQQIANLATQMQPPDVVSDSDLPSIARALLLAQDSLLPDPPALAQPFINVAPTGSPMTWAAPFWGSFLINGGSISAVGLQRQGVPITAGVIQGFFPLARGDSIVITYGGSPIFTFIPGSTA
jgi:hypothetical protein